MFFLLFGEDTYRSKEKLNEIIQQYKEKNKRGLNLFFFDYEKGFDFNDLEIAMKQTSMFAEKKLFVFSNFFSFKKEEDDNSKEPSSESGESRTSIMLNLLKKIKNENYNDIFIIFFETLKTISVQNRLFKFLKEDKNNKIQEFKLLKGAELSNWVAVQFSKYNLGIQKNALNLFLDFVGNDPWRVRNEINKLSNYCKDKQDVGVDDIKLLIQPKIDNDIFNTIEAIANKDKNRALELVHNHIQKGDNALYILSMIAYQFKNLLLIRNLIDNSKDYDEIGKELKIHPFVLRKNYRLANLFKTTDLKNIYNEILETDLKIKQGGFNPPQLGIELLILKPYRF